MPNAEPAFLPQQRRQPHQTFLPGINGIPFRGAQAPLLKRHEIKKLKTVYDGKVRVFDMSKKEDELEYNRIWDCVVKQIYHGYVEDRQFSDKTSNFIIFARWAELHKELPGSMYERATKDQHGQISFKSV